MQTSPGERLGAFREVFKAAGRCHPSVLLWNEKPPDGVQTDPDVNLDGRLSGIPPFPDKPVFWPREPRIDETGGSPPRFSGWTALGFAFRTVFGAGRLHFWLDGRVFRWTASRLSRTDAFLAGRMAVFLPRRPSWSLGPPSFHPRRRLRKTDGRPAIFSAVFLQEGASWHAGSSSRR